MSGLYVAIPLMDELDWIFRTLESLDEQDIGGFDVWLCVNQPDSWWKDETKRRVCLNNRKTIEALRERRQRNPFRNFTVTILDKSSPGLGWPDKKSGVGPARKAVMDAISATARDGDIIVCSDGDTVFDSNYLSGVLEVFSENPRAVALSAPYYHRLVGDEATDRAVLRYECYLRYYSINLFRISSPYAYTAIGSAISLPVRSYRKVGGMPAKLCGEDFYFLQKLGKTGPILSWSEGRVYPAARFSGRVPFGTGAAMRKGPESSWKPYPILSCKSFDEVGETIGMFDRMYRKTLDTPLHSFLCKLFRTDDPWAPLRKNSSSPAAFTRACHQRFDALRMFQYLRSEQAKRPGTDEEHLLEFLAEFHGDPPAPVGPGFSFDKSPIWEINALRDRLDDIEQTLRRRHG